MSKDNTHTAYDRLLQKTGGKGTRRELGTVRATDFRKPKESDQGGDGK